MSLLCERVALEVACLSGTIAQLARRLSVDCYDLAGAYLGSSRLRHLNDVGLQLKPCHSALREN